MLPSSITLKEFSNMLEEDVDKVLESAQSIGEEIGIDIYDEFQLLDASILELLCIEFDREHKFVDTDNSHFKKRPPVITIMGHVDHGKTTLVDAFRNSKLVD